ncbi:N-acetylgalactosamine-4-sulfatase [Cellulophaga algicola DSM 14237]|uniref:N-acetylgalactosamine-4-sulfatase n=1 Tax=Cellulophaga algicola (strain DSM 14237 / IC166 / ACAM 630) TaxID=688270 RepID=E6X8Z9_CELAD|nr:arylsulfatase [Cellulophaga algicola]ADV49770.1 N-acetylgalactosamine-4-sulfatase [Cellulophaga algicola DSM 14237]
MNHKLMGLLIFITFFSGFSMQKNKENPPNVILILADDLGIGDLGCQGNPWIKTPKIDAFYQEAVRMTDFHVSPLCTPTRAALMTGQYPINNGAWATFKGRDALSEDASTIADIFKANGYKTGLFGKWHLGDNYPSRPTDSGFDTAIHHLAGGIGELSDYWGNSYFDDVYYVNNQPKQFEGYCTDVWFKEATRFIAQNKEDPFFVYLPLNAPHDPLIVAEKYAEPYKKLEGKEISSANLYGMIANIDENFGKFHQYLEEQNLLENTILIFMSDNGTRFGYSRDGKFGYNKGYRGIKGDKEEGGHRVPFFIRWPDGKIAGGRDVNTNAAHVDLIPTLAALCHLSIPESTPLDGLDFSSSILSKESLASNRTIFLHNRQDWRPPYYEDGTCIIKNQWRLINGTALYDITKDPQQHQNLADKYPEIVVQLLKENKVFLNSVKTNKTYSELPLNHIGSKEQLELKLTIQHAIGEDEGIWKCEQVAEGMKNTNNTHAIYVEQEGDYLISLRRWPKECPGAIWDVPHENPKNLFQYKRITPTKAKISIANQILEKGIKPQEEEVVFTVHLQKGKTFLINDFIENETSYGVYYTYITQID